MIQVQSDSIRIRSGGVDRKAFCRRQDSTRSRRPIVWMSSREKGGHIWQRGQHRCMKLGQGERVWGSTRRPADRSRTFLLLSGVRLNGKSRLDYGEPQIISKERFFSYVQWEGIIESIQDLPCCCNYWFLCLSTGVRPSGMRKNVWFKYCNT